MYNVLFCNHNLIKMPKKPRIKERKNRMWSAARKHNRHTVHQKYLKGMFMPMVRTSWKGYGVNNATFTTGADLDNKKWITNGANDGADTSTGVDEYGVPTGWAAVGVDDRIDWLNRAGDLNAIQCLPGRQIYMEFCALPMYKISEGLHTGTTRCNDLLKGGYMRSVFDLFQTCLNNHAFTTGGYNAHEGDIPAAGASVPNNDVYDKLVAGLIDWNTETSNDRDAHRIIHSTFLYEGGQQSHKFTNETTLPIYIEIREFTPKNMMHYSGMRTDDNGRGGDMQTDGSNYSYGRYPGMYESIYEDRKMQLSGWNSTGTSSTMLDRVDGTKFFDQLSDADFKYKGKMPITDMRWKVGDAKVHRIDPGETFTYTMILPPFSVKMTDILRFQNNYRGYIAGAVQNSFQNENGTKAFGFNPIFSKFVQIRARGSKSFCQIAGQNAPTGGMQFDSFADREVATSLVTGATWTNITSDSQVIGLTSDVTRTNPTTIKAVTTHAAMLTHTMSENHQCRLLPFVKTYAIEKYDWSANAADNRLVTIYDRMMAMDPVDNNLEGVAMDDTGLNNTGIDNTEEGIGKPYQLQNDAATTNTGQPGTGVGNYEKA